MKYLPKETCEYLVSIGCTSESGVWETEDGQYVDYRDELETYTPAFSLEDILRKENAEKIGKAVRKYGWDVALDALVIYFDNPDTWPEEVAKLIKP